MLWVIIIAIAVFFFLFSMANKESGISEPPAPPTFDVHVLGCNGECGYFDPEIEKKANGNYGTTGMVRCKYQHKTVRMGSRCPFAEDHPELLRESVLRCK